MSDEQQQLERRQQERAFLQKRLEHWQDVVESEQFKKCDEECVIDFLRPAKKRFAEHPRKASLRATTRQGVARDKYRTVPKRSK